MANTPDEAATARAIEITRRGKIYKGSFTVAGGTMTVAYLASIRKAGIGDAANPEVLAQKLLGELVEEADRNTGAPGA